jgi:predicted nuclease with TOPRIM domain
MEEAEYKEWWKLHRRHALGETLSPDEQAVYLGGKQRLEAEEQLHFDMTEMKRLREEILRWDAEYEQRQEQRRQLRQRIAELEARLDDQTKQALGIGI